MQSPSKARQILANHIEKLILTPKETDNGPVYEVSGDIDLFGGDRTAMSLWSKLRWVVEQGQKVCNAGGGQRRDRTADAGLFRAALYH